MKRQLLITLCVLAGGIVYSYLFWRTPLGINAVLFSIFAVSAAGVFYPEYRRHKGVLVAAAGTLLSAVLLTWHHTIIAKLLHVISLFLLIGFVQGRELRFIGYAFMLGLSGLFSAPVSAFQQWTQAGLGGRQLQVLGRWGRLTVIPLLLGGVFFLLYAGSNARFVALFEPVGRFLSRLFSFDLPFDLGVSFGLGMLITGSLLWHSGISDYLLRVEQTHAYELRRKRSRSNWLDLPFRPLALKRHYWTAIIALGLLNGLLLLHNLTDLRYVWMDFGQKTAAQLSEFVHEGTYVLIFSIFLAILVLLYFFRGNLNFYPHNQWLRRLAYLWLAQNALLALSIGLRNWHYLSQYGLTHKRIGVFAFLSLVLFGLWTVCQKVRDRKTVYFLFQRNGWALYLALFLLATVNWNIAITRYNLHRPSREGIDVHYLLYEMDDQNYFLLAGQKARLLQYADRETVDKGLKNKRIKLRKRLKDRDWRSWNRIDMRNRNALEMH
jgi:hypothetical protein